MKDRLPPPLRSTLGSRGAAGRPWASAMGARADRAALLAALAALVVLTGGGCGRQTHPRPYSVLLPAVSQVEARQRDAAILVAWREPHAHSAAKYRGVRGYSVQVERLPFECGAEAVRCPETSRRMLSLPAGSRELVVERGRVYWLFVPEEPRGAWRFGVAARYADGISRPAFSPFVRGMNPIPAHELRWEWSDVGGGHSQVRLTWEPRREAVVRVISGGNPPVERERFYGANLYRRPAGGAWPMLPLNEAPVQGLFWMDAPPPAEGAARDAAVEYTLRLVDAFGGEGPPAPPVRVPLVPESPR